jgi:hypothetical protein
MNPYVALGIAVLLAVSHGWAYVTGSKHKDTELKARASEQADAARKTEQIWQGAYNEASKSYLARIEVINGRLRIALDGLRDRPDRPLPETPRADCAGATGAELSKRDGEFLTWLASRADRHRAALKLCYDYADSLR